MTLLDRFRLDGKVALVTGAGHGIGAGIALGRRWSLLHYAGDGRWSYEADMYNAKAAADTIRAWLRAGGRLAAPERVKMKAL